MPVLKINTINPHTIWGIWEISEKENDLVDILEPELITDDFSIISHPTKRQEWLASRCMLKELSKEIGLDKLKIYKNSFGKPFLLNDTAKISFSHSHNYAVAIINQKKSTGIDIEQINYKVFKISQKFLSQTESNIVNNNLEELTYYWCAKETLYKVYGNKEIIFKRDLFVDKRFFGEGLFIGYILKNNIETKIQLRGEKLDNYIIVYVV
jgi:phosphopantetheinyl transferase